MMILQQKKGSLVNGKKPIRNPDSSPGIYPAAAKVAQCRLMDENRREKEEAKNKTGKKTAT